MRLLRPNRIIWMAVGAAGAYFFDPDNGQARRAMLADKVAAKRRGIVSEQDLTSLPSASPSATPHSPSPYERPVPSTAGTPGDSNASSHLG